MKSFLVQNWYYVVITILLLALAGATYFTYLYFEVQAVKKQPVTSIALKAKDSSPKPSQCVVDIKGAVQKPGVYNVSCDQNIKDAILVAGGLTKKATTDNINLSQKVKNEMVIYIYPKSSLNQSKHQIKPICEAKTIYIDTCQEQKSSLILSSNEGAEAITETSGENILDNDVVPKASVKVNINEASKEQLMELNGIGASKADSIIQYRVQHGPFHQIEDLMNVSGIGATIFENIKSQLTV